MQTNSLATKMVDFMERASWIRKMFEQGTRLKQEYGADKVCDFSLGNPDLPPPPVFLEALEDAARDRSPSIHAYMPNAGLPWVRDKIALQVGEAHGVTLSGEDIIMTCGAAGGLNVIFKAILNPGDQVIVPSPYFVEYHFYADNHLGKLVTVPCRYDFSLDINAIRAAVNEKTKAVLINSPNNPTGNCFSENKILNIIENGLPAKVPGVSGALKLPQIASCKSPGKNDNGGGGVRNGIQREDGMEPVRHLPAHIRIVLSQSQGERSDLGGRVARWQVPVLQV